MSPEESTAPTSDPYAVPERRKASEGTYAVNGVRARVDAWRAQDYSGASATSRRLLSFWFADEHRSEDGQPFRFYFCQREAVETFIFLTEIEPVHGLKDLLEYRRARDDDPAWRNKAPAIGDEDGDRLGQDDGDEPLHRVVLFPRAVRGRLADDDLVPRDRTEPDRIRAPEGRLRRRRDVPT